MTALWQLDGVCLGQRLREVTATVQPGVTAVLGQSGAGKTSLLNLLVAFERPDRGRLAVRLERGDRRLPLYWAPQDGGLWPHLSVREHLEAVGLRCDAGLRGLLDEFDLADRAGSRLETLSLGERSRLGVARALAADAAALVLDEPLAHVDPEREGRWWDAIRRRAASGVSLVFATHSPRAVLREAGRVLCLRDGRAVYEGAVEDLYHRPPSADIGRSLGELNWFGPGEAGVWLAAQPALSCLRPEQVRIEAAAGGPLIVESARFEGAVAEAELRHEPSGARRRVFHRPSGHQLQAGARVLLKTALAVLACATWTGCGARGGGPVLEVREIRTWPVPPEAATLPAPRSVAVGLDDEIVALDTAGRVLVYGADGGLRRQWPMPDVAAGKPEGACVLSDGRVVVCDTHYHRVLFFDRDGRPAGEFGREGEAPGEFVYPVSVTKDRAENLFVAEYGGNDRVQKFSRDGRALLAFGSFGTGPGQFQRPSGIVWHEGLVYVADAFNNRIQVFRDDGALVGELQDSAHPLTLQFPYDIKLGPEGALYVIEYGASRITRVGLDGRLLGRYGRAGSAAGEFATPWGIAVDSLGRIRVADTGNRRLVALEL